MRGLPFPDNGIQYREPSRETSTSSSNSAEIPIDPALSQPQLDPALLAEDGVGVHAEVRVFHTADPSPRHAPRRSLDASRRDPSSTVHESPTSHPYSR